MDILSYWGDKRFDTVDLKEKLKQTSSQESSLVMQKFLKRAAIR